MAQPSGAQDLRIGSVLRLKQPSETCQMMTQLQTSIRADCDDIDQLIATLEPLSGGIWLATDLTTHVHWAIMAESIAPVPETPDGGFCRANGLVTVCSPGGEPVFLINQGDTLAWIEPGQILAVRELGETMLEIRLERLDDLDARFICAHNNLWQRDTTMLRTIAVSDARHLQIYDQQLPTGDPEADANLRLIEMTIDERRRLVGPNAGTLDVMRQLACDLDRTMRVHPVRSFVWAAVLQEQIAGMRQLLAA